MSTALVLEALGTDTTTREILSWLNQVELAIAAKEAPDKEWKDKEKRQACRFIVKANGELDNRERSLAELIWIPAAT